MTCPECVAEVRLIVDGRWMSRKELEALPRPPHEVRKEIYHDQTCRTGAAMTAYHRPTGDRTPHAM